ncbi:MAG TPA: polyprenyl synthetase family protein [Thermoanaerobaculia bacterium]|nr:polyprenyl synthetase family protein [Thermoanaerobaculia bacterium]HUM29556.1 polyprenyl synthetase family protein [Thermoanaerobaculia bacterium]HXK67939.1 polyprenyl synthetase family protein [Thermoanaerobaculia bacterium]
MLKIWKAKIEEILPVLVPEATPPSLREAMLYSLLAGGKRFRPLLVLASAHALGREADPLVEAACATEFIHTYSLIHDDLPAMDNDVLRRGKPTSHVRFGEATAILAGDALHTEAFHILSLHPATVAPEIRIRSIETLARASGAEGMAGGQVLDMEASEAPATTASLEAIHRGKTARLIQASVLMGGLYAGASESRLSQFEQFGLDLGHLFQITDDILDETSTAEAMGKSPGKDREQNKITATRILGLSGALESARGLASRLDSILQTMEGDDRPLRSLVDLVTSHLPE